MRRIVIVGQSGAGKTRLSLLLAQRLHFPVLHADKLFWRPGWVDPEDEDYRSRIHALTEQDSWIFDGIPGRVFDIILPRADTVIWLQQPPFKSMVRGYWRMLRYWGRTRPGMADGCPERLNLQLWRYAARFESIQRPRIEEWIKTYAPSATVLTLQGDEGVVRFLDRDFTQPTASLSSE
ncbi:MAG TPA: topology modulation protein [Sphingobium sp.]